MNATKSHHHIDAETRNALLRAKNGSLRQLAHELGYPREFAATLSKILTDKPGQVSQTTENELRRRLGLPAIGHVPVPVCPTCGEAHVAPDCHGKPVAAVVVLRREEVVTRRRPRRQPERWVDYATAALRQALEDRQPYQPPTFRSSP